MPTGFAALMVADRVSPTRYIAVNTNDDLYAKLRIITGDQGNVAFRDTNQQIRNYRTNNGKPLCGKV